jgi:nucleoside phosphorylase
MIVDPGKQVVSGTRFEVGRFSEQAGVSWDVVIAQVGEGTGNAAALTERAINHFHPSHVFFLGVAGGIKDVKLGDVVAATKVYGYESGKAGAEFHTRPELGQASHEMEQSARFLCTNDDWLRRIGESVPDRVPKVFIKPIASGEKLVADTRSPICRHIRKQYSDAVAVDMEGIGFFKAIHANAGVQAIEVRGISDLIDGKAESDSEGWQKRAAEHAAAFAFEMLAEIGGGDDAWAVDPQDPTKEQERGHDDPGRYAEPPGEFERLIEDKLRDLFSGTAMAPLTIPIANEARESGTVDPDADPARLLCTPDVSVEDAVTWLTIVVRDRIEQGSENINALKDQARQALGWLILRAVDPDWLRDHAPGLHETGGVQLDVNLKHHACLEVVLSRTEEHNAEFRFDSLQQRVLGRRGAGWGAETGIAPETKSQELIKVIWEMVIRRPFPGVLSEDQGKTLKARLKVSARNKLPYYLTLPLDDPGAPLTETDLAALQRNFPYLRLIFIRIGGRSALLVDEFELNEQLLQFLTIVGDGS